MFNFTDEEVNLDDLLKPEKEEETKTGEAEEEIEEKEVTPAHIMYDYLRENNYVEELDKVTEEELEKQVSSLPQKLLNNYLSNYSEEERKILDYVVKGASFDDIKNYIDKSKPVEVKVSKEEYLKEKFKDNFLNDEELEEHIEALKAEDKIDQYYNHFLEKDTEAEKLKAEEERKKKEEELEKQKKRVSEFNENLHKEYAELPWNEDVKKEVAPYVNANKISEISTKVASSPKAFIQLALFMSKFDSEKNEFNLDEFGSSVVSKMNEEELKNLQKKSFSNKLKTLSNTSTDKPKKNNLLTQLIIEE